MTDLLNNLGTLQKTQDRIDDALAALDGLQQEVESNRTSAAELLKKRNDVQDRFDLAQRAWQDLESGVASRKEELRQWEARMNGLSDWREQQALQAAIRDQKRQIEYAERDIREKVDQVSTLEAEYNAAQEALETTEKALAESEAAYASRRSEIEANLANEYAARSQMLESCGPVERRRWENFSLRGQSKVVVTARDGICGFCHVSLLPQSWVEVLKKENPVHCQGCQRILIHESYLEVAADAGSGDSPQAEVG